MPLTASLYLPNHVLALMQSVKGRPDSEIARFEECSTGIGKMPDGAAAFAKAKVLIRRLAVGSKGFYDYVKG